MAKDRLGRFVESILISGLLSTEEAESLSRTSAQADANPELIAKDLVKRGLLTSFQVKSFWKGREVFLNQYLLIDKIGAGGMGEVFQARHTRLDRIVALKVMRKEKLASPDAVKRFRREIRAVSSLTHENVVLAYDADQLRDIHFFAMEYVDGPTLDHLVREKGPLSTERACNYIRQAAFGLQQAHEKNLIHRDIKPSNLLLTSTGIVKISDFGLALLEESGASDPASKLTKEGLVVGTPDFLAPEQSRNARGADIRSDIYALGCTFYYLLTGSVPYPGGTATERMLRHSREALPEPPNQPAEVLAILSRMTAKKPAERFQTPQELASALGNFITNPAAPPSSWLLPSLSESNNLTAEDSTADDDDSRLKIPVVNSTTQTNRSIDPPSSRRVVLGAVLISVSIFVVLLTFMLIKLLR